MQKVCPEEDFCFHDMCYQLISLTKSSILTTETFGQGIVFKIEK